MLLVSLSVIGQQEKNIHHFMVDIIDGDSLVVTHLDNCTLKIENPDNIRESAVYSIYTIYSFQKAYPNTTKETFKNRYRIAANSESVLYELQKHFPEKYLNIEAYEPLPNAYYPNDYGTTSPVENLGVPYPLTHLDAMNLPSAWGITKGSKKVVIGVSDARVDSTNIDLQGRVSNYLSYSNANRGTACSHGTTQVSIIGAKMDNGYGIPGICSECDIIVNGYGQFDHIQELVEAGAKVINASWTNCGFGASHQNVQERINEYYEQGILIVAAAGNARRCNPYLRDYASNYGYPASFKNVISVSSVYGECGHYEDCIVEDKQFGTIAYKLKDRHVGRQFMKEMGSFDELAPINVQFSTQHNLAVDIVAPAETYLAGRKACGNEEFFYGGVTSTSASMVTGVIGLIWSANYCLASAEVESILKLSAEDIEPLPGNEPFKMKLGAGRVDAYRAVKMAHEMQLEQGIVEVANRDFYRFDFKLFSSPYQIELKNQTFRDSSTVDFKARKRIHLKPGTRLAPDHNGFVKLSIDPSLPTEECFPEPVVPRPKVERDSVPNPPKHDAPFILQRNLEIKGVQVEPVDGVLDTDYEVVIETDKEIFRKSFKREETAMISLPEIINETVTITLISKLYLMERKLRINTP
jgi:hypothetical protein